MSSDTNRIAIVLLAAAVIVVMGVIIFLAWSADSETVGRLQDFVRYLDDHRDNPSRLILTLGALVVMVLALLLIIVQLAPQEETRELKVQQAGTTTILPAEALRQRLEEALTSLPAVTAARARVSGSDKGIITGLDLTITPDSNIALATQEATQIVVETIQRDLGLPVASPPEVRIAFATPEVKPSEAMPAKAEPVASSVVRPPSETAPAGDQPAQELPQGSGDLPPTEPSTPREEWQRPPSGDEPSSDRP